MNPEVWFLIQLYPRIGTQPFNHGAVSVQIPTGPRHLDRLFDTKLNSNVHCLRANYPTISPPQSFSSPSLKESFVRGYQYFRSFSPFCPTCPRIILKIKSICQSKTRPTVYSRADNGTNTNSTPPADMHGTSAQCDRVSSIVALA